MSISEGIGSYYGGFGIKGLLAISSFRLLGMPKIITARPDGIKFPVYLRVRTSDVALYRCILLEGEYQVDLPFSPQTIVDLGANCGLTSVYYANKYPKARIIAVEPEETNYHCLVRNVSQYPNVVPIRAAVWNKDGEVSTVDVGNDWACQVSEGSGCRAITMRTLMAETGVDSIDLLKVDIEGAEKEIFSQCDWIDRVRVLIVELHDRFKPGCRETVERATQGWHQYERGELTILAASDALPVTP
jgi:FkbM family methyltransferase